MNIICKIIGHDVMPYYDFDEDFNRAIKFDCFRCHKMTKEAEST